MEARMFDRPLTVTTLQAADYKGDTKTAYELGFAWANGMATIANITNELVYISGYNVTSKVSARRSTTVKFFVKIVPKCSSLDPRLKGLSCGFPKDHVMRDKSNWYVAGKTGSAIKGYVTVSDIAQGIRLAVDQNSLTGVAIPQATDMTLGSVENSQAIPSSSTYVEDPGVAKNRMIIYIVVACCVLCPICCAVCCFYYFCRGNKKEEKVVVQSQGVGVEIQ
jgi:hypothetical protein